MTGSLGDLLACPDCRAPLEVTGEELRCPAGHAHPVVEGVPVLLPTGEAGRHKRRQAAFYVEEDAEFEIRRPAGTPRLHGWLLEEKFRRSVAGLEPRLRGATALTVCSGSGMDADWLARSGVRVIASDLSLGAARRTLERARRTGLDIVPLVADVERLPFRDGSVDLVYVHDGLHHLVDPFEGLREMARVAAGAVSVTEPARAAATALSVRAGVSIEVEEAGNAVARLDPHELVHELERLGFTVLGSDRYAMFYRHHAGPAARFLSRGRTFPAARAAMLAFNGLFGGVGNKLAVRAVRRA